MLRKKTDEQDPADWLAFAQERLAAADLLKAREELTPACIECLQEAAGRLLKGYLIAKDWSLVKSLDLRRLVRDAGRFDSRFLKFLPLAENLTADFFAQHYPGGDLTHVGENYETLRQQTGELVALIRESLSQYFTDPEKP
ncbi:MAG: HEPN domain-containing protein [Verrucomicrobia bacterium]|nr:HEPN domain-containing protein [Verrucomicrobiota bacterium]